MTTTRTWPEIAHEAARAGREGKPWERVWASLGPDLRRLQAQCPNSRLSLYGRTLSIWASGDEDGTEPPDGLGEPSEPTHGGGDDAEFRGNSRQPP
jgi:hypothetical protein